MPQDAIDPDPLKSIANGATNATLNYLDGKISDLIKKFRQGDLAFIEDQETIDIVKTQRRKPAWKIYREYIKDKDLLLQIEMGFSLKALEKSPNKLHDLKSKILHKYDTNGLHVAELSQNGLIEKYLMFLIEETSEEKELQGNIEDLLNNIDRYVNFIKNDHDAHKCTEGILAKIRAFNPKAFIVFSKGTDANAKSKDIVNSVMSGIDGYRLEVQKDYRRSQNYYFIVREDDLRLENCISG
ncbi:MAG: hypothetical protein V1822_04340 [Candidatus Micrarchaeota archaeon]